MAEVVQERPEHPFEQARGEDRPARGVGALRLQARLDIETLESFGET